MMVVDAYMFGAGASTNSLNPADKAASVILSGGNLTATKSGSTAFASVRSVVSKTSGKWYYEATFVEFSSSFIIAGIANSSAGLGTFIGADANGIAVLNTGDYYTGGAATPLFPALSEGNVLGIALDLDARLVWFRVGAGNWNNSGTADPATGTGGISLPAGMSTGAVYAAVSVQTTGDQFTVNFGATAFANAPPSGYSAFN